MIRELAFPVLILVLSVLGLALFGIISVSVSLFAALAVGLIFVGAVKFILPGNPMLSLALIGAGVAMFVLAQTFPSLTIGDTLSAAGVGP